LGNKVRKKRAKANQRDVNLFTATLGRGIEWRGEAFSAGSIFFCGCHLARGLELQERESSGGERRIGKFDIGNRHGKKK